VLARVILSVIDSRVDTALMGKLNSRGSLATVEMIVKFEISTTGILRPELVILSSRLRSMLCEVSLPLIKHTVIHVLITKLLTL
jgi:hypothetical protein